MHQNEPRHGKRIAGIASIVALALVPIGHAIAQDAATPATRLRVLLVIDTHAGNVGGSFDVHRRAAIQDEQRWKSLLNEVFRDAASKGSEKSYTLDVLKDDRVTPERITMAIKEMQVEHTETLLVYYSGHGATDSTAFKSIISRYKSQGTERQQMAEMMLQFLATSGGNIYKSAIFSAVNNARDDGQRPKLTVVLTDCCSSFFPLDDANARRPAAEWKAFNDLFFKQDGVVHVTAASTGELGWTSGNFGGFFTVVFTKLLCVPHKQLDANGNGCVEWTEFTRIVSKETNRLFLSQRAQSPRNAEIRDSQSQYPMGIHVPAKKLGHNGRNCHVWKYVGSHNQQWRIIDVGDGYVQILSRDGAVALDADLSYRGDGNDRNVHLWKYVGNWNQQWKIEDLGDGTRRISPRFDERRSLDADMRRTGNGRNVLLWEFVGNKNQRWKVSPVGEDFVKITSAADESLCLDSDNFLGPVFGFR